MAKRKSEQLYHGYGEYDFHQYDHCFKILNKYIAFVRGLCYAHSPMSAAGDGVAPFMNDVILSLYLYLPGRANSTSSVLCSYLAGLQKLNISQNHPL